MSMVLMKGGAPSRGRKPSLIHIICALSLLQPLHFVSPVINGLRQTLAHLIRIIKSLRGRTSRIADGIELGKTASGPAWCAAKGPLAKLETSSLRNLISIYLNSTIEPKILIAGNHAA
jgi:hypothetical protein